MTFFFPPWRAEKQRSGCTSSKEDGQMDGGLDAAPPTVYHGHDVGEVQAFYHHLHEVLVTAGTGHKLLQGELAWQRQRWHLKGRGKKQTSG